MKAVIDGKKYDTETAELICERRIEGFSWRGFDHTTLYRKKNGEFFFLRETYVTGPDCWARLTPRVQTAVKYKAETGEDTEAFVEKYGSVEDYERAFGEVKE